MALALPKNDLPFKQVVDRALEELQTTGQAEETA